MAPHVWVITKPKMIKKFLYKLKYGKEPESVEYWKRQDAQEAKVVRAKEGHLVMYIKGEKYPFPGFPRGILLYGSLSPLKHLIKNRIFNQSWKMLEEGKPNEEVVKHIKASLDEIFCLPDKGKPEDSESREVKPYRYDMLPVEALNPPVKEVWRAFSKIEKMGHRVKGLKELLCFIIQEDDAYRMRVQFLSRFFNPNSWWRRWRDPVKDFDLALSMLEHAEIVGDMKERARLLRRVLLVALKDPAIKNCFIALCKEMDWKKLNLTDADLYYLRAKWYKPDFPYYNY